MDDSLQNVHAAITELRARNRRVEAEKAWETSWLRIGSIALITYVAAVFVLWMIGAPRMFLSASVPVIGFVLSTQSLPWIRHRWIQRREKVFER